MNNQGSSALEYLIAGLAVVAAASYVIKLSISSLSGKKPKGCGGGCPGCSRAGTCSERVPTVVAEPPRRTL